MEETLTSENPSPEKISKSHGQEMIWTTGRRKTAIAQVQMVSSKEGGKVTVNKVSVDDYFKGNTRHAMVATQSLKVAKNPSGYNFFIRVHGGGLTGQAEAIRHGTARALVRWDDKLRPLLRKEGYLTRDPRAVERKKSGQPKARKRFQYSKR